MDADAQTSEAPYLPRADDPALVYTQGVHGETHGSEQQARHCHVLLRLRLDDVQRLFDVLRLSPCVHE